MKKVKTKKTRFLGVGVKKRAVLVVAAFALFCGGVMAQDDESTRFTVNHVEKANFTSITAANLQDFATIANPNDEDKTFLIYNVGAKRFLNIGGYFGHQAVLSRSPQKFWIQSSDDTKQFESGNDATSTDGATVFISQDQFYANIGKYLGFKPRDSKQDINGEPLEGSVGVFVDQNVDDTNAQYCKWTLVPVNDGKNSYLLKLATELPENVVDYQNASASTDNAVYYLSASGRHVLGFQENKDNDDYYLYHKFLATSNQYEAKEIRDDFTFKDESTKDVSTELIKEEPTDQYGQWRLITLKEYKGLYDNVDKDVYNPLDITYELNDPKFTKDCKYLENWKTVGDFTTTAEGSKDGNAFIKYNDAKLAFGYDGYYKTSTTDETYLHGASSDYHYCSEIDYGTDQMLANHGWNMGAIMRNVQTGTIYQEIQVNHPGWYYVSCGASCNELNTSANLFIECNGKKGVDNDMIVSSTNSYLSTKPDYLPGIDDDKDFFWPYDNNMPMYNSYINSEYMTYDVATSSSPDRWYACVYVDNQDLNGQSATLKIGLEMKKVSDKINEDDVEYMKVPWAAFSNVKLYYGGDNVDDLYLDEGKTDYSYLDDVANTFSKVNLHLFRSFAADKWNTIILPVGLNETQFKKAFGDDAALAELSDVTTDRIVFTKVTSPSRYESESTTSDQTKYWLKPMTPYIIKTSKKWGDDLWEISMNDFMGTIYPYVSLNGGMKAMSYMPLSSTIPSLLVSETLEGLCEMVDETLKIHQFLFENVKMVPGVAPWDFENSHWNFEKGLNVEGEGNYVVKGKSVGTYGSITPYGTLTANYYIKSEYDSDTEEDITKTYKVETNADMNKSYVVSSGTDGTMNVMKMIGANGVKTKGLRCYFRYTSPEGVQNAKMNFGVDINGILDDTTSIDGLFGEDTTVGKYMDGIYTLGGQCVRKNSTSMDNLPKGIYIVNGKKTIKD